MSSREARGPVRLTVVRSEPLARLAEQRLRQEGINCMVRALGAGPGGWGTAADLPYGLYVKQADEMRARQLLELPPMEISEREVPQASPQSLRRTNLTLPLLLVAVIVLGSIGLALRAFL